MNIFYLDVDIQKCAEYHCDRHVVKMLVEYCQLLCSAINLTGGSAPYKTTHKNHPCAVWVRKSQIHWLYLQKLSEYLNEQFIIRYGKNHKSGLISSKLICPAIPNFQWEDPPQCMPEQYRTSDTVQAYRNYYLTEKSKFATWKINQPYWWV